MRKLMLLMLGNLCEITAPAHNCVGYSLDGNEWQILKDNGRQFNKRIIYAGEGRVKGYHKG